MQRTRVVVAALALSALAGCYESHFITLDGERYRCNCRITETLLIPTEFSDRGIPTSWETIDITRPADVLACTTFEGDPATVCREACNDRDSYGERFLGVTAFGEAESPAHTALAAGQCNSAEGFQWRFPSPPADAVHNGRVVSALSTMQVTVNGLPSGPVVSDVFAPDDGTPVSIRGGLADLESGTDDLSFETIELARRAAPVAIGSYVASNVGVVLSTAHESRVLFQPTSVVTDDWQPWRGSTSHPDGSPIEVPFELTATITGEGCPAEAPCTIGVPVRVPVAAFGADPFSFDATDDYNLRRPTNDRFLQLRFQASADIPADGPRPALNLQLAVNAYVRFFSGVSRPVAGVVRAPLISGSTPTPTIILDGRATTDLVGAGPALWEWRIVEGTRSEFIARGSRAVLTEARAARLAADYPAGKICLYVMDGDLLSNEGCTGIEALKNGPTTTDRLDCVEAVNSLTSNRDFAQLLEKSGVLPQLAQLPEVTIFAPESGSLSPADVAWLLEPKNGQALQAFVRSHLYASSMPSSKFASELLKTKPLSNLPPLVKPADVLKQGRMLDLPCTQGFVHDVAGPLRPPR